MRTKLFINKKLDKVLWLYDSNPGSNVTVQNHFFRYLSCIFLRLITFGSYSVLIEYIKELKGTY